MGSSNFCERNLIKMFKATELQIISGIIGLITLSGKEVFVLPGASV